MDDIKYISLYNKTPHLEGYLKFYNKYKKRINFFPVDLRIIFNDIDFHNIFNTIEIFFTVFNFDIINDKIHDIKINENVKCKNNVFFFIIKLLDSKF
jgi:hypothetical protein